jgi:hypothetical protein
MKLWLGNIAPGTSTRSCASSSEKYGAVEVTSIEQVPGDGSRPAAILEVEAVQEAMYKLTQRLNGMYWKGRSLTAQSMTR